MSADRTGFVDCTSLCTNGTLSDLSSEGTGLRIGFDFCRLLRTKEMSTDFRDPSFLVSRCLSHFCFNYYYSAGTAIVFPSPWTYEKEAKSTIHGYIILVVKSTSGIKCLMLPAFSATEVDYSMIECQMFSYLSQWSVEMVASLWDYGSNSLLLRHTFLCVALARVW